MKNSELLTILQGPVKWFRAFNLNESPNEARQSIINDIIRQRDEYIKNYSVSEKATINAKERIRCNMVFIKYLRRLLSDYKNNLIPVFNTWDEASDAYPDDFPEYPEYNRRAVWITEEDNDTADSIAFYTKEIYSSYKIILEYKGFISRAEHYWESKDLNLPSFSLQTMDNHILIYHAEQECGEWIEFFKVPK